MSWKRIVLYGIVLWLVPFVIAFALYGVHESNRPLFESLITVIGVACAVIGALRLFRDSRAVGLAPGLKVGFAWAAISILLDLPIFLAVFHMPLPVYAADIGLTYLAFPLIATGISLAVESGRTQRDLRPRP